MKVLAILIALSAASDTLARTWRVELNGSGDFTDIQPAVDAAAEGDTIHIGSGRFVTFHPITAPAWTEDTIVGVLKDDLTFIGSGQDVTILGPPNYRGASGENPKVFCSFGGYSARISDMTIAQVETGIAWEHGDLQVRRCRFYATNAGFDGMHLWTDSCSVANCSIVLPYGGTGALVMNQFGNMSSFRMSDCDIAGANYGIQVGYGAPNVVIERTSISGPYCGISVEFGSSVTVDQVVISGVTNRSLRVADASTVTIRDSELRGGILGIDASGGSVVAATGLVISETTSAALRFILNAQAAINGSHVLTSSGLAFDCYSYSSTPITVDLTGNYWGTTDSSAISAMIRDSNDDPSLHCTALYEPFANGPLPTESTSWGDLKASFR